MFKSIKNYFLGVKKEMKKVSWLSKKEIIRSTVIVFIFSLIVGLFLFFVDNAFVQLYNKLIN